MQGAHEAEKQAAAAAVEYGNGVLREFPHSTQQPSETRESEY